VSYQNARIQWIGSSIWGGSAGQNIDIPIVIADLKALERVHCADPIDLSKTISVLTDFGRLPVTGYTAALNARWESDVTTISTFLNAQQDNAGCFPLKGRWYLAALRAWESQPKSATSGVKPGLLREAAADLQKSSQTKVGNTGCNATAISDLFLLAKATKPDIASSAKVKRLTVADCTTDCQVDTCVHTVEGDAVAYLNGFFTLMEEHPWVLTASGC
jgi:hypothetical protein